MGDLQRLAESPGSAGKTRSSTRHDSLARAYDDDIGLSIECSHLVERGRFEFDVRPHLERLDQELHLFLEAIGFTIPVHVWPCTTRILRRTNPSCNCSARDGDWKTSRRCQLGDLGKIRLHSSNGWRKSPVHVPNGEGLRGTLGRCGWRAPVSHPHSCLLVRSADGARQSPRLRHSAGPLAGVEPRLKKNRQIGAARRPARAAELRIDPACP